MAPKKEEKKKSYMEELGFNKASERIESFKNRRVYFVRPLSLALSTARVDKKTGLPGFPAGCIIEVAGSPGKTKSSLWEHAIISMIQDDPKNHVALLQYEVFDNERFDNLRNIGLDTDRVNIMDYAGAELNTAETGLNSLLELAYYECRERKEDEEDDTHIVACVIDSFGAMGVAREIFGTNKQGKPTEELKGVDTTPQMAVRAQVITRFINQWITLDPLKRPMLIIVNHMKAQLEAGGAHGIDQLAPERVGEDLNLVTLGGKGFVFHCDLRIRADARKWPPSKPTDEKHPLFDNKVQEGLEVFYEVYRNRYFPGKKMCKGILNFSDRKKVFWDLEDEVIAYAAYLDLEGIVDKGMGRFAFPKLGEAGYRKAQCIQYLRDNQDYMWHLIREIAKTPEKLFKIKKVEKKVDKDDKDSPV